MYPSPAVSRSSRDGGAAVGIRSAVTLDDPDDVSLQIGQWRTAFARSGLPAVASRMLCSPSALRGRRLVRTVGLEPTRVTPPASKTGMSTNFITSAGCHRFIQNRRPCQMFCSIRLPAPRLSADFWSKSEKGRLTSSLQASGCPCGHLSNKISR